MCDNSYQKAKTILKDRFSSDTLIALATIDENGPHVRTVDAYYEDNCFYIITYAKSNKMAQINHNPKVAIAAEWFTAHGEGINLGWFGKKQNQEIADKLKKAFSTWIDNGHNDFGDENTIILCIKLTDGILFSHDTRYDIDFFRQRTKIIIL